MKNKHIKSFFEGIEEGLHWTPVGLLTVPLWAFRKQRHASWYYFNSYILGGWAGTGLIILFETIIKPML